LSLLSTEVEGELEAAAVLVVIEGVLVEVVEGVLVEVTLAEGDLEGVEEDLVVKVVVVVVVIGV